MFINNKKSMTFIYRLITFILMEHHTSAYARRRAYAKIRSNLRGKNIGLHKRIIADNIAKTMLEFDHRDRSYMLARITKTIEAAVESELIVLERQINDIKASYKIVDDVEKVDCYLNVETSQTQSNAPGNVIEAELN